MTKPREYTRTSPNLHRSAPRRVRKVVAFYGLDYQWVVRLINSELKIQRKLKERTPPNTTKYAAAVSSILQCEQVLRRMRDGVVEWENSQVNKEQG